MIQPLSWLNVADNSGARKLMCIRVLGSSSGSIGDVIIAVVKDALPNMPTKRSDVVRAVIVRTSKGVRRENGMMVRFDDNAAVIINKEGNPSCSCYGESISLKLKSNPEEDTKLAKRQLNMLDEY